MEERKFATVLFADFVDSTALGSQHDPEVVRAAFGATFARMRDILVAHGGTVEKFIGDAVMAVFGVPSAHEDDALRAVRASFALRDHVAQGATSPVRIGLRVGINTGEVVAGTGGGRDFLVTGQPVNLGARLQSSAEPGQILVGALTRELTEGYVRYGPELTVAAKGFGTVSAWPAVEPLSEPIAGTIRSASLVDRVDEMRMLVETYERVRMDRTPRLVTVYGPPGVGKSRLADEFVTRASLSRVRRGRCVAYGEGVALAPLQGILRAEAGIGANDSPDEAARKMGVTVRAAFGEAGDEVERAAQRLVVLAGIASVETALGDVPQESVAQELDWALRRYVEQRSAGAPFTLIFEDVHWAEPALLDTIEHLAEWTRGALLILCLARPEFFEHRPSWSGGRPNTTTLPLRPLSVEDTRELVATLVPADRASANEDIVQRAEGNPLYAEELVRLFLDRGEPMATVPATLQGLIAARLDAADPGVKALLQHASVIGRVFWTDALGELGEDRANMRTRLLEAMRHDFIVDLGARGPGEGWSYRFSHALTREVAYGSLAKSERSSLHDRFSQWLEAAAASRGADEVEAVAFHAERAYALAYELGVARVPELGRRAFALLLIAARSANARADYRASQSLYERALTIGESARGDAGLLVEARGRAAIARLRLESSTDALADVHRALEEARRHGASATLAALLQWSAMYAPDPDADEASSLYHEAVDVARAVRDPSVLAAVLRSSARPAASRGDLGEERRILLEARELLSATDDRVQLPRVLLDLAANAVGQGDFGGGRRYLNDAIPLVHDVVGRVLANRSEAEFLRAIGELDRARAAGEDALDAARELGSPFAIVYAAVLLGCVLRELGQREPSRAVLEDALITARGRTPNPLLSQLRCELALTQLALGAADVARIHADEAVTARMDAATASLAKSTFASIAAAEGAIDRAAGLFRDSLELLAPTGLERERALRRLEWARVLMSSGRAKEARPLVESARAFYVDPLAVRRRSEIEALIRTLDVSGVAPADAVRPRH